MKNQSATPTLQLKVYSVKLNQNHIKHLKNNSQGLPPSVYLRSLVEVDMNRGGALSTENTKEGKENG